MVERSGLRERETYDAWKVIVRLREAVTGEEEVRVSVDWYVPPCTGA